MQEKLENKVPRNLKLPKDAKIKVVHLPQKRNKKLLVHYLIKIIFEIKLVKFEFSK